MQDAFRYCFRFCCDPGFNDETETQSLLRFCSEALVDDVMVFVNVQELNTGHLDEREQAVYLRLLERLGPLLAARGVTLSVNHWHSLMHADLGKSLRDGQDFTLMVDPEGRAASLCVCPESGAWRRYIGGVYARYAALHPDTVWVEDDFRLHNHAPLAWGGCFCDGHMRRFSERAGLPAGETLTREAFLAGVLRPGAPHPYRRIWLDVCRESMEGAAEAIAQAVHAVDPQVKIGLMSSVPYVHAAEGRDWQRLLGIFAGGNRPVSRIHLPAYQELAPSKYLQAFHMVSMHNRALLSADTLVYPELENYPYSRFSKSHRFTRFQLLSALALDVAGMTIDLFDLNGRGIIFADGYQDMLRAVKGYLNRLNGMGVFSRPRRGVCVLTDPDAAYRLHTREGRSLEELYPHEVFWAGLLPAMGVPFYYATDPAASRGVVAVSGQYLRCLDADAIERLFADNFVLLNGDALDTLLSLGLGCLAGVAAARWMRQDTGEYTFEQAVDGRRYTGVERARASAVISASDALLADYLPAAEVRQYTRFFDSFRRDRGPCETVVDGRVFVYPFGRFASPQDIPPMLLNDVRQQIVQHALAASGRLDAPMVLDAPYLTPYCMDGDAGSLCLYLVNGALDTAERVSLRVGGPDRALRVTALPSDGQEHAFLAEVRGGNCTLPLSVAPMESVLLILEETTTQTEDAR